MSTPAAQTHSPVQAPPVVVARALTKTYDTGGAQVHALAGVDVVGPRDRPSHLPAEPASERLLKPEA